MRCDTRDWANYEQVWSHFPVGRISTCAGTNKNPITTMIHFQKKGTNDTSVVGGVDSLHIPVVVWGASWMFFTDTTSCRCHFDKKRTNKKRLERERLFCDVTNVRCQPCQRDGAFTCLYDHKNTLQRFSTDFTKTMEPTTANNLPLTNAMKWIILLTSAVARSEGNAFLRGPNSDKTTIARHRGLQQHSNKAGLMIVLVVIIMILTTLHLYASYYNSLPKISDGNTVRAETSNDDDSISDEDEEVPSNPTFSEEAM